MHNAPQRIALSPRDGAIPSLQLLAVTEEPNDAAAYWRQDPNVVTMERLRDGDMEAFHVLFRKYRRTVVNFAYRFLRSHEQAEEIAQTVFMQLFRARERYQPAARFTTFLYRIATNCCLNELRRYEYSGNIDSLDVTDPESNGDGSSFADRLVDVDSPGPPERLACREAAAEIAKVLDRVPPNQRTALLLSRVDGLTHREIAAGLDSSTGAVKSLIFRATNALRRDLAEIL